METATLENTALAGQLVVGADGKGMSAARHHVHSIAREHFSEDEAQDILIAVGEAISNAYRHGTTDRTRGVICLDWSYANRTLTVSVKDDGPGLSSKAAAALKSRTSLRGHGFDIMTHTVDHIHVEQDNGTRLVLKKRASWNLKNLGC